MTQMASRDDAMKLVEKFVADAAKVTPAQRAQVVARLTAMGNSTECAASPFGKIAPEYMLIAAERIAAIA
jgi:hypothetical protein